MPTGATFTGSVIDNEPNNGYFQATYQIFIRPNPASETIYIQPWNCTMLVDEVVIDTICTLRDPLCTVDFRHFAKFAQHWLNAPCDENNTWCDGADLNHIDGVDWADLRLLLDEWLYSCPDN
ncbi:MAG: hypothetical protein ACYS76_07935 [Planctomycetota bacterium]